MLDKDLFHMLTPNPSHNKSFGLVSTGANIMKSDRYGFIQNGDPFPVLQANYDNPYSNGLSRTLLLK